MPDASELARLTDAQLDGRLDDAGFGRLEALLAADPGARRAYLQHVFLHGELACADDVLLSLVSRDLLPQLAADRPAAPDRTAVHSGAMLASALVLLVAVGAALWHWPARDAPSQAVAQWASADVRGSRTNRPALETAALRTGTVKISGGAARVRFRSGTEVHLAGPSLVGVVSDDYVTLPAGTLTIHSIQRAAPFIVDTPQVRIVERGAEFGVAVNAAGETEVHVFAGEVAVRKRARIPRHYWSFDGEDLSSCQTAPEITATLRGTATRGHGLVGSGGLELDNTLHAGMYIDPAHNASFAVSAGVSVEALIAPRWTGHGWSTRDAFDYDEIFRKEDGHQRILLALQNDHGAGIPRVPDGPLAPCLAFGLHLADHGYSELDMPLDGKDGRPTLAQMQDGGWWHVVATYDSFSGKKALWLNGREVYAAIFPPGTLIKSGGPAPAVIGNMAAGIEPFRGLIDEVAFYDFALEAAEIKDHYERARLGKPYFDALAVASAPATTLRAGQAARFAVERGKPQGEIPLQRAPFQRTPVVD